MNRKYERPDVKQVTKIWVRENCKNVTSRDIGLLKTIYENKRRFLRRDQIERLYPNFASTDRLTKRINVLYRKHIVDKVYPPVPLGQGSSQQYVCLDRAGMILLDVESYSKPITDNDWGERRFFLGWEHKAMLNEYECVIREVAKKCGGEVVLYEVEEVHSYQDKRFIPDIFCYVKGKRGGYLLFIEVDLGTEDIPHLKEKMDKYRDYYISREWVRLPWVRREKPTFPLVMFFTEDGKKRRVEVLEKYVEEHLVKFFFGFHCEFEEVLTSLLGR